MATLVVSNVGERYLLDHVLSVPWSSGDSWTIHLYKNNFTPNKDMVLSDFTEATFGSYAAKTLTRATWTPAVTFSGIAISFYGTLPLTWTSSSGPQTCYGYYVTEDAGGELLFAQAFDSPQIVTALAPALVLPQLTLHSESEP